MRPKLQKQSALKLGSHYYREPSAPAEGGSTYFFNQSMAER